ncbi:hypothetical protein R3P38DRAFT_3104829 [Favolaschia claudopus]|uniref:Uncharacterized protein n=1 Tax=Favolaschia claudopus TaxID=2862362 RepID=A0AAV9ZJK0_9AGAR
MDADQTPAPIPVFTSEIDEARETAIMAGAMAGLMLGELRKNVSALLKTAQKFPFLLTWKALPSCYRRSTKYATSCYICRQYHAPDLRPAAVSDTPSPPTFAEVVKAPPEPAETRPQQPSKPRHQPTAARRDAAKPSRRALPSTRLIKPHPASLCNALNDALGGRLAVSAVSTTRSGNLILHASAPACSAPACSAPACSAQALAAHRSLPPMYLADPWHKVVFHRVPLMQPGALPSDRDFIREVAKRNQLPGTQYRIGNVRFLLERDKAPREEVTVRVDFIEQEDARRFLRDGIFLFGSHCRATRYKPRSSNGRQTSGGHG